MSSFKLTTTEEKVLGRGLNFNQGKQPDTRKVVCAVEGAIGLVEKDMQDEIRTRAIGILSRIRKSGAQQALSEDERKAVKALRQNKRIAVLPADKGNVTVVLDRSAYQSKMEKILEDTTTYAQVNKDPTPKVQTCLQKLLSDIFLGRPASEKRLYYQLLCTNGSAPAIYGLPKIHKNETPLRPIVDFTRSPLNRLSRYLHRILAPLAGKTETHLRNTSDFISKVKGISVDEDEVIVSFDVCSLFTSIPVDLAVETSRRLLHGDPTLQDRTSLDVTELCALLRFCLSNTYFSYNGAFYKQVFGTAMGASISVTTANLTMEALEARALESFQPRPKVFLRYVDDCFCVIDKKDIQRFLDCLNSVEPSIKFTVEEEKDGCLPFLDALVKRAPTGLSFSVYRKPTHSGRYLGFESVHPMVHKRSVVRSLVERACRTCSDTSSLQEELEIIESELTRNGYPRHFIRKTAKSLMKNKPTETQAMDAEAPRKKRAAVPYIRGVSEALARVFRKHGVQIAHVPASKLKGDLMNVKDPLPRERFPGVVYKIPCADCESVYIGESGNFCRRLKQHKNDVAKGHTVTNALAEHAEKTGHAINWDNARILATEKNVTTRLNLESLIIQTTSNTINRSSGTLNHVYSRTLRHALNTT